jgi:hypothetical protein
MADASSKQCLVVLYFITSSSSTPGLDGFKPSTGAPVGYEPSTDKSTSGGVDKGTSLKPADTLVPTAPGSRMNGYAFSPPLQSMLCDY